MEFTYLDWAATAPPDPEALETARRVALELFGNPSSLHTAGKAAAAVLEESRSSIAGNLGCRPEQLYFTSGGTESNNIIFSSLLMRPKKGAVLTSSIEHSCIWEAGETMNSLGFPHLIVNPGKDGIISPHSVVEKLSPETELISIMLVNNETGSIQDVPALHRAVNDSFPGGKKPHFHSDAVQALGKIPVNLTELGIDSASFSGHKIGAPRGIGLLYLKKPLTPLFRGGGQENGIRPGTENLPSIAALAAVLSKRTRELDINRKKAVEIRRRLVEGLGAVPEVIFLPRGIDPLDEKLVPNILKCSFPPVPGEVLQRVLSDKGIMVSTGSACSSNQKHKTNRVLKAMGTSPATAESSIRFSWGPETRDDEIEMFINTAAREIRLLQEQLR